MQDSHSLPSGSAQGSNKWILEKKVKKSVLLFNFYVCNSSFSDSKQF